MKTAVPPKATVPCIDSRHPHVTIINDNETHIYKYENLQSIHVTKEPHNTQWIFLNFDDRTNPRIRIRTDRNDQIVEFLKEGRISHVHHGENQYVSNLTEKASFTLTVHKIK